MSNKREQYGCFNTCVFAPVCRCAFNSFLCSAQLPFNCKHCNAVIHIIVSCSLQATYGSIDEGAGAAKLPFICNHCNADTPSFLALQATYGSIDKGAGADHQQAAKLPIDCGHCNPNSHHRFLLSAGHIRQHR